MVVLKPTLPGERFRVCSCGVIGLASPIKERTTFYPTNNRDTKRHRGMYHARCRRCQVQESVAYGRAHPEKVKQWNDKRLVRHRERMATDPEYRERHRARDREYRRQRMENPELRERARTAARRYTRKNAKRLAENHRIDRRLQALETGRLKVTDVSSADRKQGQRYPIGPFRDWVEGQYAIALRAALLEGHSDEVADQRAVNEVAADLGVNTRTLYRWRFEMPTISDVALDQVATHHGKVLLSDWYPEGSE